MKINRLLFTDTLFNKILCWGWIVLTIIWLIQSEINEAIFSLIISILIFDEIYSVYYTMKELLELEWLIKKRDKNNEHTPTI